MEYRFYHSPQGSDKKFYICVGGALSLNPRHAQPFETETPQRTIEILRRNLKSRLKSGHFSDTDLYGKQINQVVTELEKVT